MGPPRSIEVLNMSKQGPETPKVEVLAWTGPNATVTHRSGGGTAIKY